MQGQLHQVTSFDLFEAKLEEKLRSLTRQCENLFEWCYENRRECVSVGRTLPEVFAGVVDRVGAPAGLKRNFVDWLRVRENVSKKVIKKLARKDVLALGRTIDDDTDLVSVADEVIKLQPNSDGVRGVGKIKAVARNAGIPLVRKNLGVTDRVTKKAVMLLLRTVVAEIRLGHGSSAIETIRKWCEDRDITGVI